MPDSTRKILFVCLGNICRSPAAEAVFRAQVKEAGREKDFEIDSAGILDIHAGEAADSRMRTHARSRGYEITSISRPVSLKDFDHFDLIVAMDHQNLRDLKSLAPDATAGKKISLMLSYAPWLVLQEVPDPYYGGAEGFGKVLDLLEEACAGLLKSFYAD